MTAATPWTTWRPSPTASLSWQKSRDGWGRRFRLPGLFTASKGSRFHWVFCKWFGPETTGDEMRYYLSRDAFFNRTSAPWAMIRAMASQHGIENLSDEEVLKELFAALSKTVNQEAILT